MMLLTRRACHSNGNDRLDKVQVEIHGFYPAFTIAEIFISFGEIAKNHFLTDGYFPFIK